MAVAPLPAEVAERSIPADLARAVRDAPDCVALMADHHRDGEVAPGTWQCATTPASSTWSAGRSR